MTEKDKAVVLAEKHGTLHSNLNQTFVTLHEKGLQTLLADHRQQVEQQVIAALANKAELMPKAKAWCLSYDDPRCGRILSDPSMCEAEIIARVKHSYERLEAVLLYPDYEVREAIAAMQAKIDLLEKK